MTKMSLDKTHRTGDLKAMSLASPMLRTVLIACLAVAGAALPCRAQEADQTINVYFQPLPGGGETSLLNKAILEALSQPPLQLAGKPFAGVVIVAVDGKVNVTHQRVSGTYFDFNVTFTRDGSSLGQSAQACKADKLSDCTDQLVQDVKSVAAPR